MPLHFHQHILPVGELGIWKIEENEAYFLEQLLLSPSEQEQLARIKGRRRVEWLASRQLVHYMSGRKERAVFVKDEFGKPHLQGSAFDISISHSHGLAAGIAAPLPVGIDIQAIVTRIERIAHKFVRPEEAAMLRADTRIVHLHAYWGAKEALYKAYGRRQLDFCQHILVEPFEYLPQGGHFQASIRKGHFSASYTLHYQLMDGFMLVYAMEIEKQI
ncbi:MAG: 4'-phosphopantetheinyl transferase superfamily protein [Bacteroidota bacterium]